MHIIACFWAKSIGFVKLCQKPYRIYYKYLTITQKAFLRNVLQFSAFSFGNLPVFSFSISSSLPAFETGVFLLHGNNELTFMSEHIYCFDEEEFTY